MLSELFRRVRKIPVDRGTVIDVLVDVMKDYLSEMDRQVKASNSYEADIYEPELGALIYICAWQAIQWSMLKPRERQRFSMVLTERWASELFSDEDKLVRLRFLQTRITEYRMSLQHATDASESASIAAKKLDGYLSTSEISQSLNHSLVELYSAALTRMMGSLNYAARISRFTSD